MRIKPCTNKADRNKVAGIICDNILRMGGGYSFDGGKNVIMAKNKVKKWEGETHEN